MADGRLLVPASIDEASSTVRELQDTATPFALSSGDDAAGSTVVVSARRIAMVEVLPGSLLVRAGAGATVAAVRAAAGNAKLAVVGLPESVAAERVGSLIARGEVPRRSVAGIEAVLPTGELVRTGAAVLKDVVGYDLPALLLGSMGRLALIVAVTFRLEPAAAHTAAPAALGETPSGGGVLTAAFDPRGLLRARQR